MKSDNLERENFWIFYFLMRLSGRIVRTSDKTIPFILGTPSRGNDRNVCQRHFVQQQHRVIGRIQYALSGREMISWQVFSLVI